MSRLHWRVCVGANSIRAITPNHCAYVVAPDSCGLDWTAHVTDQRSGSVRMVALGTFAECRDACERNAAEDSAEHCSPELSA